MRRIALLVVIAASACQQSKSGTAAAPTVADTVAVAATRYNPAMFDTVHWASDSVRLARGADVFKWACAECHGPQGYGDGKKVTPKGDTLRPPNFHDAAWRLAGDREAVRRKIYTGNVQGMPHWGLRHIEPRDIDAVSSYILTVLHPAQ
jgi:mono/diheme cytochrome c family protein